MRNIFATLAAIFLLICCYSQNQHAKYLANTYSSEEITYFTKITPISNIKVMDNYSNLHDSLITSTALNKITSHTFHAKYLPGTKRYGVVKISFDGKANRLFLGRRSNDIYVHMANQGENLGKAKLLLTVGNRAIFWWNPKFNKAQGIVTLKFTSMLNKKKKRGLFN